jgi:hypothetical protein
MQAKMIGSIPLFRILSSISWVRQDILHSGPGGPHDDIGAKNGLYRFGASSTRSRSTVLAHLVLLRAQPYVNNLSKSKLDGKISMFVGIDLHKNYMQIDVMNDKGKVLENSRINNDLKQVDVEF